MSFTRQLASVAAAAAFSAAQAGTVIHVDAGNCPGPGNGSELNPYCSIQDAIEAAVDTDEIVVAPGTYFETIDFLGKAITLRSSDGPEATIIDALFTGSVVTCNTGEGPGTVLQGFTIKRGYNLDGGGMLNDGTSPIVIDCIFFGDFVDAVPDGRGGGMFNRGGSPTVIDCTFDSNVAGGLNQGSGGGMYNEDSSPSYSDVQGGWSGAGSNNIDADPLFVSLSDCCALHFAPGCDDADCAVAVCELATARPTSSTSSPCLGCGGLVRDHARGREIDYSGR